MKQPVDDNRMQNQFQGHAINHLSLTIMNFTASHETFPQMARPIICLPRQSLDQSCDLSATVTKCYWWYGFAWLGTQSCTTCLQNLVSWNHRSRVLNITIDFAVFRFVIIHDFYNQLHDVKVLYSCDSSYSTVMHSSKHSHKPGLC